MITLHTRFEYSGTAKDLTTNDLGYQIYQTEMIYDALVEGNTEFIAHNHPVLRMWEGFEYALVTYSNELGDWYMRDRGFQADSPGRIAWKIKNLLRSESTLTRQEPPWKNDPDVARSHRSNMARRRPDTYGQTWPKTPESMPYLWPFIDDSVESGYKLMVSKQEREMLASGERKLPLSIKKRVHNL